MCNLTAPDIASSVNIPTLILQVRKDFRTTASDIEKVFDNLGTSDKLLLWIDDVEERLEGYNYFSRKPEKMIEWFDKL